jgi:integrase
MPLKMSVRVPILGVSKNPILEPSPVRYLFKRKGSDNWYVRLQPPGQKIVEKSLGTSDLKLAEITAMPLIREHKAFMYQRRPTVTPFWHRAYEPGLRVIDGEQAIATDRELQFLDDGGNVIRCEPNGGPAELLSPAPRGGPSFKAYDDAKRPTPAVKNGDDALLETYIKHNGIDGLRERQARDIWHIFRTVVKKPLKQCTRDDGRAIIAHLEEQAGGEIKSATLRRRMVPLVATVNLAIDEGKLTFNPFSGVVPDRDDEDEREAFDDADMKLIRANLHLLSKTDQLLVRLLATTGMRRGEAFEINREQIENGIRFVTIGTKTPQSLRRVPFPVDLLPYLPPKITGQLIPGRMDTAGKRLREWLTEIGITDPDKAPMHSFRHRAAQRLRAGGIEESLREAVGGWANGKKKKTSRKYGNKHGKGFPLSMLKKAIDKIRC